MGLFDASDVAVAAGLESVYLSWKFNPANHGDFFGNGVGIGFLIHRNNGVESQLIAALPVESGKTDYSFTRYF